MPRFFKQQIFLDPVLTGDDAAHVARSLRMRVGEELTVCDLAGTDHLCRITAVSPDRVDLEIVESTPNRTEPTLSVTLFQCMPKSDKMETVIKQAVQLGVTGIVPVLSSRCISVPDAKTCVRKSERWQKIADEAAKQSERGILPTVGTALSFAEMLDRFSDFDRVLFCYEKGGVSIRSCGVTGGRCAVVVGPEGGFSPEEAEKATAAGATVCTLGPRILRTETAPLAALAVLMTVTGNLD